MASDFGKLSQFNYLYDALTKKYPGLTGDPDGTSVFQFTTTPTQASWSTGTDLNAYDIANAVPLDLNGFYTPGDQLDTAYKDLIVSIEPANYADNQSYTKAQTRLGALNQSQTQIIQNANSAYYTWVANNTASDGTPTATKTEWLLDPLGGASWQNKLTAIQNKIASQTAKLSSIVKSMDGALARAQAAALTDTMPISRGGPAIQVPAVSISGNLGDDLERWADYKDGQYDFEVVINKDSVIKHPWKTTYKTTVKQDCWTTSASVNVNTARIISDVHYRLKVTAVGMGTYKITRGKWYDSNYVDPNVKIAAGATVSSDTFFGLKGSLHLVPDTIFVMYKPTFQMTMSTEVYKQQFVANADAKIDWLNIFGFRFKFDGLASLQPVSEDNNKTTITFSSPDSAKPQIIGVVSKVIYNGSTRIASRDRSDKLLTNLLPQYLEEDEITSPMVLGVGPQDKLSVEASGNPLDLRISREQPFGAAPFVVYNTATKATLGAGRCPALTAHPSYVPVHIPPNVAYTVQNLSSNVSIRIS